jgi:CheY-like chemotaxis protein
MESMARILLVDDEPDILELLVSVLTADGHEVETASDGVAALMLLAQGGYDAILSDIQMPRLDGIGLYQAVEARYPALARRFVVVTGSGLTGEVKRFVDQVRPPVVDKPFDFEQIRRVARQVLDT